MDSLKDVLVIIPARAGSKGIPGKNLRKLYGKPLLQYSVEAAQKVFDNPQIALSTDSVEMQKLGLSTYISFNESLKNGIPGYAP